MTDLEKVNKVISLYKQGIEVEKIVKEMGYSHAQSLSRFMKRMNYKWDNQLKNYSLIDNGIELKQKTVSNVQTQADSSNKIDALDLLENQEVLSLLQQSDILLSIIEKQKSRSSSAQGIEKTTYNFWKKANEFAFMRKASYTTSVRLPIELNDRFNKFKAETSLTQTQLLCMALDYFMNKFETKLIKH